MTASSHYLERKEKHTYGGSHSDIYASLAHYGCEILSPTLVSDGRILPIEELVAEILDKSCELIEVENVPALLLRNSFDPDELINKSRRYRIQNKTGYICELTERLSPQGAGDILKGIPLSQVYDTLFKEKKPGLFPLPNGIDAERYSRVFGLDELQSKWGIAGVISYSDISRSLKSACAAQKTSRDTQRKIDI